jgi:hypothetical protein
LTAVECTNTHQRHNNTVGLLDRLGHLAPFFCHDHALGKRPHVGQTLGHNVTGGDGGQGELAEAGWDRLPFWGCHDPPRYVQRHPKVPRAEVHQAQAGLGHDVEVNSATGRGLGEGALSRRNGALVVTHRRDRPAHIVRDQGEPMGIAQRLGQGFSGTDVVEYTRFLSEWQQRAAQVEVDVDGLFVPGAALRELLQGHQRLPHWPPPSGGLLVACKAA